MDNQEFRNRLSIMPCDTFCDARNEESCNASGCAAVEQLVKLKPEGTEFLVSSNIPYEGKDISALLSFAVCLGIDHS